MATDDGVELPSEGMMVQAHAGRVKGREGGDKWPPQVDLILSAIDTGQHSKTNRRDSRRNPYRVRAHLRLFSDPPLSSPWTLYTRDIHARGLGFITPHRLPLGYGGLVEIPGPEGGVLNINCTLLRCRQAAPGWYEGSVYFNREQPRFSLPVSKSVTE